MVTTRQWAELRFSVIGQLLAAPPTVRGDLAATLAALAAKTWTHPTTGEPVRFAASTIERWFYQARRHRADPVNALAPKLRSDIGRTAFAHGPLREALHAQYAAHGSWSAKLHHDNLTVLTGQDSRLGPCPSYQALRRYMRGTGLRRQRRRPRARDRVESPVQHEAREVRSYEATHCGSLVHLDFHFGKLRIVTVSGSVQAPVALAMIDDRSRLICHVQWYLGESTRDLVHGFSQALMKRGLPGSVMTDNGSAMTSAEFTQGLLRLGIQQRTTMAYSPHQNAKIEAFWGHLEGRLVAMVEGLSGRITLDDLNRATLAWVEQEYNRAVHSVTGEAPLDRFLSGPSVWRPCPEPAALRAAFRLEETRLQRRSDGTVVISGIRFEVPQALRHVTSLVVRYARWDLALVDVVDGRTGVVVCALHPLDRARNADSRRRVVSEHDAPPRPATGMAPLLSKIIADYESTGLPPAFLSQTEKSEEPT